MKIEPLCTGVKALECLLVVVVFFSMIVSIKLYSAVHPVRRRPNLNVLRVTAWPFVSVPPARV